MEVRSFECEEVFQVGGCWRDRGDSLVRGTSYILTVLVLTIVDVERSCLHNFDLGTDIWDEI